jgi:hypothetical protein
MTAQLGMGVEVEPLTMERLACSVSSEDSSEPKQVKDLGRGCKMQCWSTPGPPSQKQSGQWIQHWH